MVARHLEARGIDDPLVLAAMGAVPREAFVPEPLTEFAYEDSALPIEAGQTISQPYIVARMIELAELQPGDKVLEVGAGSGYAAAVMSRIAGKVSAIERHEELASSGARAAEAGSATTMPRSSAPTAPRACRSTRRSTPSSSRPAARTCRRRSSSQLAIGGRLVIPVGRDVHQTLLRVRRLGETDFEEEDFGAVTFVPLIGEEGWAEPGAAKKETKIDAETLGLRRWAADALAARQGDPLDAEPSHRRGRRAVRRSRRADAPCRALRA